jgi:hypothetical protein
MKTLRVMAESGIFVPIVLILLWSFAVWLLNRREK